jgi:flagellar motor protein MotB
VYERELDSSAGNATVWAAVGDLMACLVGLFVLLFVAVVASQVSLASDLAEAEAERDDAAGRIGELEQAFAGLAGQGRIAIEGGRIGIAGELLFAFSSAQLTEEGRQLLGELAAPLRRHLQRGDQMAMISGFTDDVRVRAGAAGFRDNWELSAQRALTVTRTLVAAGVPAKRLFAAGFGNNHPVAPNDSENNRALNRRVQIVPVERVQTVGK